MIVVVVVVVVCGECEAVKKLGEDVNDRTWSFAMSWHEPSPQ
jgi:hypothetical protein